MYTILTSLRLCSEHNVSCRYTNNIVFVQLCTPRAVCYSYVQHLLSVTAVYTTCCPLQLCTPCVLCYSCVHYTLFVTATDENSFILMTDADVKFTPDSVEALLDLIIRDPRVGAVCSRTHPMGSGPLYWYQIFDYAIGHWIQKVL